MRRFATRVLGSTTPLRFCVSPVITPPQPTTFKSLQEEAESCVMHLWPDEPLKREFHLKRVLQMFSESLTKLPPSDSINPSDCVDSSKSMMDVKVPTVPPNAVAGIDSTTDAAEDTDKVQQLWEEVNNCTDWPDEIQIEFKFPTSIALFHEKCYKYVAVSLRPGAVYCDEVKCTTLSDVKHEARKAFGFLGKKPCVSWPEPSTFLVFEKCKYDRHAVQAWGHTSQLKEYEDTKQCVQVVYGESGSGKTVFSCVTLPEIWGLSRERGDLVIHFQLRNEYVSAVLDKLMEHDKNSNMRVTSEEADAELCNLLLAEAVVQNRTVYPIYKDICNKIFEKRKRSYHVRERNNEAYKVIINIIKDYFRQTLVDSSQDSQGWMSNDSVVEKFGTVVLVLDEIGKCLALARGVAAVFGELRRNTFVQHHMEQLKVVLCGTGAESLMLRSRTYAATDPRTICAVQLLHLKERYKQEMLEATTAHLPQVQKAFAENALIRVAMQNVRIAVLLMRTVSTLGSITLLSDQTKSERLNERLVKRYDTLLTEALPSLILNVALVGFCARNGIGEIRDATEMHPLDAVVKYMQNKHAALPFNQTTHALNSKQAWSAGNLKEAKLLEQCQTLIPLPVGSEIYKEELFTASTRGLVVRGAKQEVTAPMAMVAMGAFEDPGLHLTGESLERFTHAWLVRLYEAQSGLRGHPHSLIREQLPHDSNNRNARAVDADTLGLLLRLLRENKSLGILNGENAPGADVMGVQIRPRYDEVKGYMSLDEYNKVWPPGVVARVTVVSCKKTSKPHYGQLATLGVLQGTNLVAHIGPRVLAWLGVCAWCSVYSNSAHDVSKEQSECKDMASAVKDHDYAAVLEYLLAAIKRASTAFRASVVVTPCLVSGNYDPGDLSFDVYEKLLTNFADKPNKWVHNTCRGEYLVLTSENVKPLVMTSSGSKNIQ